MDPKHTVAMECWARPEAKIPLRCKMVPLHDRSNLRYLKSLNVAFFFPKGKHRGSLTHVFLNLIPLDILTYAVVLGLDLSKPSCFAI